MNCINLECNRYGELIYPHEIIGGGNGSKHRHCEERSDAAISGDKSEITLSLLGLLRHTSWFLAMTRRGMLAIPFIEHYLKNRSPICY